MCSVMRFATAAGEFAQNFIRPGDAAVADRASRFLHAFVSIWGKRLLKGLSITFTRENINKKITRFVFFPNLKI